jgi:hypothetical protein
MKDIDLHGAIDVPEPVPIGYGEGVNRLMAIVSRRA